MTTVLWDEVEPHGLLVEPLERFEQTLAALARLRAVSTLGELRRAELPAWARMVVTRFESSLEENGEPSGDDVAFRYDRISRRVVDAVPLPTDVDATEAWLGTDLLRLHARITSAPPGGDVDEYRAQNREAFLAALRYAGFIPLHRPGFYTELLRSC